MNSNQPESKEVKTSDITNHISLDNCGINHTFLVDLEDNFEYTAIDQEKTNKAKQDLYNDQLNILEDLNKESEIINENSEELKKAYPDNILPVNYSYIYINELEILLNKINFFTFYGLIDLAFTNKLERALNSLILKYFAFDLNLGESDPDTQRAILMGRKLSFNNSLIFRIICEKIYQNLNLCIVLEKLIENSNCLSTRSNSENIGINYPLLNGFNQIYALIEEFFVKDFKKNDLKIFEFIFALYLNNNFLKSQHFFEKFNMIINDKFFEIEEFFQFITHLEIITHLEKLIQEFSFYIPNSGKLEVEDKKDIQFILIICLNFYDQVYVKKLMTGVDYTNKNFTNILYNKYFYFSFDQYLRIERDYLDILGQKKYEEEKKRANNIFTKNFSNSESKDNISLSLVNKLYNLFKSNENYLILSFLILESKLVKNKKYSVEKCLEDILKNFELNDDLRGDVFFLVIHFNPFKWQKMMHIIRITRIIKKHFLPDNFGIKDNFCLHELHKLNDAPFCIIKLLLSKLTEEINVNQKIRSKITDITGLTSAIISKKLYCDLGTLTKQLLNYPIYCWKFFIEENFIWNSFDFYQVIDRDITDNKYILFINYQNLNLDSFADKINQLKPGIKGEKKSILKINIGKIIYEIFFGKYVILTNKIMSKIIKEIETLGNIEYDNLEEVIKAIDQHNKPQKQELKTNTNNTKVEQENQKLQEFWKVINLKFKEILPSQIENFEKIINKIFTNKNNSIIHLPLIENKSLLILIISAYFYLKKYNVKIITFDDFASKFNKYKDFEILIKNCGVDYTKISENFLDLAVSDIIQLENEKILFGNFDLFQQYYLKNMFAKNQIEKIVKNQVVIFDEIDPIMLYQCSKSLFSDTKIPDSTYIEKVLRLIWEFVSSSSNLSVETIKQRVIEKINENEFENQKKKLPFVEENIENWIYQAKLSYSLTLDVEYIKDDNKKLIRIINKENKRIENNLCRWPDGIYNFLCLKEFGECPKDYHLKCLSNSNFSYIDSMSAKIIGFSSIIAYDNTIGIFKPLYKIPENFSFQIKSENRYFERRDHCPCYNEEVWYQGVKDICIQEEEKNIIIISETIKMADKIFNELSKEMKNSNKMQFIFLPNIKKENNPEQNSSNTNNSSLNILIISKINIEENLNFFLNNVDSNYTVNGIYLILSFIPQNFQIIHMVFSLVNKKGNLGTYKMLLFPRINNNNKNGKGKIDFISLEIENIEKIRKSKFSKMIQLQEITSNYLKFEEEYISDLIRSQGNNQSQEKEIMQKLRTGFAFYFNQIELGKKKYPESLEQLKTEIIEIIK